MEEREGIPRSSLVRVHTLESRFEADLLVDALRQEGVPVLVRCYEETAYDGLFVTQMGWGALLVPAADQEKATDLIQRVLTSVEQEKATGFKGEEQGG